MRETSDLDASYGRALEACHALLAHLLDCPLADVTAYVPDGAPLWDVAEATVADYWQAEVYISTLHPLSEVDIMAVRTARQTISITLETGSGNQIALDPQAGDWNISGFNAEFAESIPLHPRGIYKESVLGNDVTPEFAVAVYHDGALTSVLVAKVWDMLMRKGTFAADVTTDPCVGGPWHLKIIVVVTGCDGGTDTFTMPNVRVGFDYASIKEGNTLSMSGKCHRGVGAEPVQQVSS